MSGSESDAWKYLRERFGVDEAVLEGVALKEVSGDFWLVSQDAETSLEVKTSGFRFVRTRNIGFKPTTYCLQFLGDRIERNVVDVEREELVLLLDGELVEEDAEGVGYVALRHGEPVVGCGFYADGTVSSRIPKDRAKELREILVERTESSQCP